MIGSSNILPSMRIIRGVWTAEQVPTYSSSVLTDHAMHESLHSIWTAGYPIGSRLLPSFLTTWKHPLSLLCS